MIVDTFAGPGGWDEALKMLGESSVGIEWDHAACRTAVAAGHPRIRADVAQYPTEPFVGKVSGFIASPPCQAWSMAGKRKGELDRANCHRLADRMAAGDDSTDWTDWEDARSPLVCQPVRWVRDLRPEWVALEEVPAVESLWRQYARIFQGWGYSTWVGVLNSADYGVPQTRERCVLMASRTSLVQPPEPTHAKEPAHDLFGGSRLPWISMADALGWSESDTVRKAYGEGMVERHGERPDHPATEPSATVISKSRSWLRMGNQDHSAVRHVDEPAATVVFGARSNKVEWFEDHPSAMGDVRSSNGCVRPVAQPSPTLTSSMDNGNFRWIHDRPATTVVGSFSPDVISPPGYRTSISRQNAEGGVRVTVAEGGVLQSFPADYPWQGSRSKQYEQVGNAIPPRLAAHVLAALGVGRLPVELAA